MLKSLGNYLLRILIWLDQGFNVIFLNGSPDETVSSRIGKVKYKHNGKIPWRYPFFKLLDKLLEELDDNHSIEAIEEDESRDSY